MRAYSLSIMISTFMNTCTACCLKAALSDTHLVHAKVCYVYVTHV